MCPQFSSRACIINASVTVTGTGTSHLIRLSSEAWLKVRPSSQSGTGSIFRHLMQFLICSTNSFEALNEWQLTYDVLNRNYKYFNYLLLV